MESIKRHNIKFKNKLSRFRGPSQFSSKTSLMILRNYPTPRKLLEEDREILYSLVSKWSKGRIKRETVDRLISLAEDSIGSPIDIDAIEIEIPFIIEEIFFLKKKIEEIEKKIDR